ncbi:hypothetical protein [Levilactobacillus sp. HBUAS70063]
MIIDIYLAKRILLKMAAAVIVELVRVVDMQAKENRKREGV